MARPEFDPNAVPETREEARELGILADVIYAEPGEFMPLPVRRVLYLVGLAALIVAPSIAVEFPAYGQAIETAGNLLGAAALGTALANPTR